MTRAEPMMTRPCSTCGGQGCEEGCGTCEWAHAGPDSHKVCRTCGGSGRAREENVTEPTCMYCGDPLNGGPGTWWSKRTAMEVCSSTTAAHFHEVAQ